MKLPDPSDPDPDPSDPDPTPAPTGEPSEQPTGDDPSPSDGPPDPVDDDGDVADTGADLRALLALALLALLTGALLRRPARRPATGSED